jgi:hypothetical protein
LSLDTWKHPGFARFRKSPSLQTESNDFIA